MKKHITVEQLKEIKEETLIEVIHDDVAEYILESIYVYPISDSEKDSALEQLSEKITIGKIIEILYKYDCDLEIVSAGKQWYVGVAGHIETQAIELVDALWEATKSVLEGEE